MAEQPACPAIRADDICPLPDSGVLADGRPSTLVGVITDPQVGSVDNSRRNTTSMNDRPGRFRHMLIGYARASTADQNPDHRIDALIRADVDRDNVMSISRAARRHPVRSSISPCTCCARATR
ncbi:hypothetical protein ACFWPV_16695 [Streptomyces uncialis]|uniref:hypothetical protein n=1 Tax=Streptomyces uncialis TaxID=1048205 RepID=UPI003656F274